MDGTEGCKADISKCCLCIQYLGEPCSGQDSVQGRLEGAFIAGSLLA